jgi:hypothetical protein
MNKFRIMVMATSFLLLGHILEAQVPQILNYQGRVAVNGTNFDGTGQFKFALVNPGGTTNYWSNDGTAIGQPAIAVSLTVTKGLYSVLLGDTMISNMTAAVPVAVFANFNVLLRLWFNDGVTGFQQLTPDQRIAAVGYALMAANVPDGSITSNKIAVGAVGPSALAVGVMTASDISNNFVTASQGLTASNLAASAASTNFVAATVAGATNNLLTQSYIVFYDTGRTNYYRDMLSCLSNVSSDCHAYLANTTETWTRNTNLTGNIISIAATNFIIDGGPATCLVVDNQFTNDISGASVEILAVNGDADFAIRNLKIVMTRRYASQSKFNWYGIGLNGDTNALLQNIYGQENCYGNFPESNGHSEALFIAVSSNTHNLTIDNCRYGMVEPPGLYSVSVTNNPGYVTPLLVSHGNNGDLIVKNCVSYGVEPFFFDYNIGSSVPTYINCRARYPGATLGASTIASSLPDLTNAVALFNEQENLSYYLPGTDPVFYGYDIYSNVDAVTVYPANSPLGLAANSVQNNQFSVSGGGTTLTFSSGGTNYSWSVTHSP